MITTACFSFGSKRHFAAFNTHAGTNKFFGPERGARRDDSSLVVESCSNNDHSFDSSLDSEGRILHFCYVDRPDRVVENRLLLRPQAIASSEYQNFENKQGVSHHRRPLFRFAFRSYSQLRPPAVKAGVGLRLRRGQRAHLIVSIRLCAPHRSAFSLLYSSGIDPLRIIVPANASRGGLA